MRPAVDGSPTVEADTVPGCLDRLTLAGCTDEVEGLDRRPSIYKSVLVANDHVLERIFPKNGRCRKVLRVLAAGETTGPPSAVGGEGRVRDVGRGVCAKIGCT